MTQDTPCKETTHILAWQTNVGVGVHLLAIVSCSQSDALLYIDIHQKSIRAMLLQHEDSRKIISIQKQIAIKQQVEKQYTYKYIDDGTLFICAWCLVIKYIVVYLFLAIIYRGRYYQTCTRWSPPPNESFQAKNKW